MEKTRTRKRAGISCNSENILRGVHIDELPIFLGTLDNLIVNSNTF